METKTTHRHVLETLNYNNQKGALFDNFLLIISLIIISGNRARRQDWCIRRYLHGKVSDPLLSLRSHINYKTFHRPERVQDVQDEDRIFISDDLRNADTTVAACISRAVDEIDAAAVQAARVSRPDVRSSKQPRLKIKKKNIAVVKEALVPGERDDGVVPHNGEGLPSNRPLIFTNIDNAAQSSPLDKHHDNHPDFIQFPGTADATRVPSNVLSRMSPENGINCAPIDSARSAVCRSTTPCRVTSDI
jgi:hypothetical protein